MGTWRGPRVAWGFTSRRNRRVASDAASNQSFSLGIAGRASEPQPFRKRVTHAQSAVIPDSVTSGRVTEGLHIADLNNDGSLPA